MDIEKLLNYLERKTADSHELQAASAIIGLRQRVQELEELLKESYKDADEVLRPRVQELEKELYSAIKLQDEANALLIEQARTNESLKLERDQLLEVKAAENASWNAGFNVQADQIAKLTAERDKVAQYWQIAEGRCDALKQQRDKLLAALAIAEPVMEANAGPSRLADFRAAIARVKGGAA